MWIIVGRSQAYSRMFFNNAFINNNFEYIDKKSAADKKVEMSPPMQNETNESLSIDDLEKKNRF
jgi:hypothetical protein